MYTYVIPKNVLLCHFCHIGFMGHKGKVWYKDETIIDIIEINFKYDY